MLKETLFEGLKCGITSTAEGLTGVQQWNGSTALAAFIVFVIYIVIILLIGKFLWNIVLCKLISIAKPAESIWQILGLAILLHVLYF